MPEHPEHVRCENCWFFAAAQTAPDGFCRFYAPQIGSLPTTKWAQVGRGDWCGQFLDEKPLAFMPPDERKAALRQRFYK